jgi:hypothetical protein
VNPVVGVPTANDPTWIVPDIVDPVLYANGLDVLIYYSLVFNLFIFK